MKAQDRADRLERAAAAAIERSAQAAQRAAQRHGMGGGNRAGGKYPLNAGNYTGAYAAQPRHASNRYAPAFDRGTHGNYGHGNYGGVKRSREFETGGWPRQ